MSKDTTKIRINQVKLRRKERKDTKMPEIGITNMVFHYIQSNRWQYLCHMKYEGTFLCTVIIIQIVIMCFSCVEASDF